MANALIVLAEGFEEIEAVSVVDILRRGEVALTVASVGKYEIRAAHGLRVVANCLIDQCQFDDYDMIILPGGMPGAEYLFDSEILAEMLMAQNKRQAFIAAICASPALVLAPLGILDECQATCYPAFADKIPNYVARPKVVIDKNIITSQGPATAIDFALSLLIELRGQTVADAVAEEMLISKI